MYYFAFIVFVNSQEEYSPEDPANPCVNYPTEEYESYADCDDLFIRRFLPPGLKPFWTVDNISDATDTFYLENDLFEGSNLGIIKPGFLFTSFPYLVEVSNQIADLFSGLKISDCLLPCVRTVATVEEGTVTKWFGSSMFSLMFNDEVRVKKTSVDKFRFSDSLNFFGSNLGL